MKLQLHQELIVVTLFNLFLVCLSSKISDLRLCADNSCEVVLSYARTLAKHKQNDPVFLSFDRNEIVEITSKSAGARPDLWGGKIGDKKGYFPRSFVREYKVEVPNPSIVLPTQDVVEEKTKEKHVPAEEKKTETGKTDVVDDKDETEIDDDEDDEDRWWEKDDETDEEEKVKKDEDADADGVKDAKVKESSKPDDTESQEVDGTEIDEDDSKEKTDTTAPSSTESAGKKEEQTTDEKKEEDMKKQQESPDDAKDDKKGEEEKKEESKDVKDPTELTDDTDTDVEVEDETELTDDVPADTEALVKSKKKQTKKNDENVVGMKQSGREDETEVKDDDDAESSGAEGGKTKEEDKKPAEDDGTEIKEETKAEEKTMDVKQADNAVGKDTDKLDQEKQTDGERDADLKFKKEGIKDDKIDEDVEGIKEFIIQPSSTMENDKVADVQDKVVSSIQSSFSSELPLVKEAMGSTAQAQVANSAGKDGANVELDGYTMIDGTPFPIDMFEDTMPVVQAEKSKASVDSVPAMSVTKIEEVMEATAPPSQGQGMEQKEEKTEQKGEKVEKEEEKTRMREEVQKDADAESIPQVTSYTEKQGDEKNERKGRTKDEPVIKQPGDLEANKTSIELDLKGKDSEIEKEKLPEAKDDSVTSQEHRQPEILSQVLHHEIPQTQDTVQKNQDNADQTSDTKDQNVKASTSEEKQKEESGTDVMRAEPVKDTHTDVQQKDKTAEQSVELVGKVEETSSSKDSEQSGSDQSGSEQSGSEQSGSGQAQPEHIEMKQEQDEAQSGQQSEQREVTTLSPKSGSSSEQVVSPSEQLGQDPVDNSKVLLGEETKKDVKPVAVDSTIVPTSVLVPDTLQSSMEAFKVLDQHQNESSPDLLDKESKSQDVKPDDKVHDAYATQAFLSRQVLSHGSDTSSESIQKEPEGPSVDGDGKNKPSEGGSDQVKPSDVEDGQQKLSDDKVAQEKTSEDKGEQEKLSENKDEQKKPSDGTGDAQDGKQDQKVKDGTVQGVATSAPDVSVEPAVDGNTNLSVETSTVPFNLDDVPPPPTAKEKDKSVQGDKPSETSYETAEHWSRKINDDGLEEQEDLAYKAEQPWNSVATVMGKFIIQKLPSSLQSFLEQEPLGLSPHMTVFVTLCTMISILTVTCFSCLCQGRSKPKTDAVVVIRNLEDKLFLTTKEKENLEEEVQTMRQKLEDIEQDTVTKESSISTMGSDLQTYKLHNDVMKQKVETHEAEIKELQTQLKQTKKELKAKENQLKNSQEQLQQKDAKISDISGKLQEARNETQERNSELKTLKTENKGLTDRISQLETSKSQLTEEVDVWSEKVKSMTEQLDYAKSEQKQMSEDLALKENELEVLRDCFLQLKAFENEEEVNGEDTGKIADKLKSMMDVSRVSAMLRSMEEEKKSIQMKLDIEMQGRRDMEEKILDLERKSENMQTEKMRAERQHQESLTKLEVLSTYFKQKELEMQRELGEQEALKKEKDFRLENADVRSKMIQEQLDTYRSQVEDLKREISSAERDFRAQISANEKKAHENWLAARAAERELKESRHESSVLRQKLTDLERRLMQGPPSNVIRPLPTRGMPPPGMMGGPPPPSFDRPGSRGMPPPPNMSMRDEDMTATPGPGDRGMPNDRRLNEPPPDGHKPDRRPPPFDSRMPPPPHDIRSPPPYDRRHMPPMDRRSPPPYERGIRYPPPHLERRSPGPRGPYPPSNLPPPPHSRGPPPPHGPGPFSPSPRLDSSYKHGSSPHPYPPPAKDTEPRQQSQV